MTIGCVAVVIAARDAAETIGACLASLAGEPSLTEVCLVDDGSRDETVGQAVAVAEALGLPLTVQQLEGLGPGAARAAGTFAVSAPWLLYLDADDCLLPGGLAALVEAAGRAGESTLIVAGAWLMRRLGHEARLIPPLRLTGEPLSDATVFLAGKAGPLPVGSWLVRRAAALAWPWPPLHTAEDLVFEATLLARGDSLVVPVPVCTITVDARRQLHRDRAHFADLEATSDLLFGTRRLPAALAGLEPSFRARMAWEVARAFAHAGEPRPALAAWRRMRACDPGRASRWALLRKLGKGLVRRGFRRASPAAGQPALSCLGAVALAKDRVSSQEAQRVRKL